MTEKPVWNVKSETVLTTVDTGVMVNIPLPVINPPVELTATYQLRLLRYIIFHLIINPI